jgi:cyclic beta-1,2-glucan synthetase
MNAEGVSRYQGEPYVMPADVYTAPHFVGRSGWTWYTGSAGWMYRVWLEEVLGFHLRGDVLHVKPAIPESWPGFEIDYRYQSTRYKIRVRNNAPARAVELDGENIVDDEGVRLADDGGTHELVINLPGPSAEASLATPQMELAG